MIEEISLVLANESGDVVPVDESYVGLELRVDCAIAQIYTEIITTQNQIKDEQIKLNEKFQLALHLKKFLKEMKEYADRTANA